MYLKELIEWLEKQDPSATVAHGFGEPNSYRGYYQDLAFEPAQNVTLGSMLAYAKGAFGKTFQGYKGGDYVMGEWTDCWIAEYGTSEGDKIGPTMLRLWEIIAAKERA